MTSNHTTTSGRLPVLFIPHGGGPCFFMDWPSGGKPFARLEAWLRALPAELGFTPKAILVISGHWEETEFHVTTQSAPQLLYDYYGFPAHTYELQYPAPGSPALAARVKELLEAAGFKVKEDDQRGFDHGTFIPFKVIYPEAQIPIVQLSLESNMDPARHIAAGQALAKLRDEGVLIVGSGMSIHNLRALDGRFAAYHREFDAWLTEAACHPGAAARNSLLTNWLTAPHARTAHPREDHLLPLMVAAGAAQEDPGRQVFHDELLGMTVSAYRFG